MEESEERAVETTTNINNNTESSGRPATRMSLDVTVNWELCLFCQQASYKKIESFIGLVYTISDYFSCRIIFMNPIQKTLWSVSVYTKS